MNIFKRFKQYFFEDLPFFFAIPALLWEVFFFCIPLGAIIIMSFVDSSRESFFARFTIAHYMHLFQSTYLIILARSFLLASATAFFCLMLGYPLAYYLACKARPALRNILLFFFILPLWTNFLILIYAWYFVLEKEGLFNTILLKLGILAAPLNILNTLVSVTLVMSYCYIPFMVLPIYVILERLDWTLIEASQDLGANMKQTFLNIVLPLSLPGIVTGCLLVFVPAFGEFAIPLFMGGDKYMLTGSLIEHYFLVARNSSMGAAFTCISCLLLLAATLLLKWGLKKKFPYNEGKN